MGKGRRHKPKKNFAEKRREKQKRKNEWDNKQHRTYADIVRENENFEHYYKMQNIVPADKWDEFICTMRKNLPVAFRITGSKSEAKVLLEIIKSDFFKEILNANLKYDEEDANLKDVKEKANLKNDEEDGKLKDNKEDTNLKDDEEEANLKDDEEEANLKDDKDKVNLEDNEDKANLKDDKENANDKKTILHCLPFYPEELAWQLQLTRKDIRRSEAYFRLHNFLIAETNSGSISRQEVVSMVPPLVLDVKPWHKVLDMCAAPGSKTAQLIEMIHADEGNMPPEGFVIANDLDNNRCYMLVHQAKRLSSPNILITNHDSSSMPNFSITRPDGTKDTLKFDRILADVPCSGDGTMRKNPDIWCKWNPANGNNLHGIQYRIAKRGLELLAVGGRMVYSTCSLNPVENEAVLHRILTETQDSVQLVDCRDSVPGLVCDPGVTHWLPASKDLEYYHSWEEVPQQWQNQIRPKMFPPSKEDSLKFHLERCMRILPHHQDTGGFFVAVLEKVKPLPWENDSYISTQNIENMDSDNKKSELSLEEEAEKEEIEKNTVDKKRSLEGEKEFQEPQRKRTRVVGYREDPFVFFKDDTEDVWLSINKFYDISGDLDPRCLLVRCHEGKKRNIYFTSPAIRDIVVSNEDKVKMINTGVKTFVRCDNKNMKCAFRLAQEGMQSIFHYIGKSRKLKVAKEDLILLLQNNDPHTPPEIIKLSPVTQEFLKNFATGSCILLYEEEKTNKPYPLKLQLVGWRGTMSLRAYVPVHDAIHYLRLLGGDCSMFEKNKFKENRVSSSIDEINNGELETKDTITEGKINEN